MTLEESTTLLNPTAEAVQRIQDRMQTPTLPMSEEALIAACRSGRREAFDELVGRHYDRIYRLAYVMSGPEDARDLAQETFMAAVKAIPGFRGDAQLSTWLVSILRNQYSLFLRGKKKWRHSPLEGEEDRLPAAETDGIQTGVVSILERMKDLPEELRMTMALFYVDGLKYAEIAAAMACPVGTVRSRLFEARERLKKALTSREH